MEKRSAKPKHKREKTTEIMRYGTTGASGVRETRATEKSNRMENEHKEEGTRSEELMKTVDQGM